MEVHISDAILNRRLDLRETQEQYAQRVGVDQSQISLWENGVLPSKLNRHALVHKGGIDSRYIRENSIQAAA